MSVSRFEGRDGVRLACRETGSGRPLMLLHGFMGAGVPGDHGSAFATPELTAAIATFLAER